MATGAARNRRTRRDARQVVQITMYGRRSHLLVSLSGRGWPTPRSIGASALMVSVGGQADTKSEHRSNDPTDPWKVPTDRARQLFKGVQQEKSRKGDLRSFMARPIPDLMTWICTPPS